MILGRCIYMYVERETIHIYIYICIEDPCNPKLDCPGIQARVSRVPNTKFTTPARNLIYIRAHKLSHAYTKAQLASKVPAGIQHKHLYIYIYMCIYVCTM